MSEGPERDEHDVDAEFAAIIARWDDAPSSSLADETGDVAETTDAAAPDPTAPAGDPATDDPAEPETEVVGAGDKDASPPSDAPPDAPPATAGGFASIPVWRGAQITPEQAWTAQEEEHYTPPPPAPLPPQEDLQFWGIVVGLVGGPLLLLWLVLFRPSVSDWWTFAALGLTVLGFVLLVLRQPHSRGEDDSDNGAVL